MFLLFLSRHGAARVAPFSRRESRHLDRPEGTKIHDLARRLLIDAAVTRADRRRPLAFNQKGHNADARVFPLRVPSRRPSELATRTPSARAYEQTARRCRAIPRDNDHD